ncbi:hypothetical protein D3C75_1234210 [compost metagenome]
MLGEGFRLEAQGLDHQIGGQVEVGAGHGGDVAAAAGGGLGQGHALGADGRHRITLGHQGLGRG